MNVKRRQTIADRAIEYIEETGKPVSTGAIAKHLNKSLETVRSSLQRYVVNNPDGRLSFQDGFWRVEPLFDFTVPADGVNRDLTGVQGDWRETITACRDEITGALETLETTAERLLALGELVNVVAADASKYAAIREWIEKGETK